MPEHFFNMEITLKYTKKDSGFQPKNQTDTEVGAFH